MKVQCLNVSVPKLFASTQVIDAQVDRRLRDFVEEVQVILDSLDE